MAQSDYRFSRRDIRVYTGWSDGQLKIHCGRLSDLEYLLIHRGRRGQSLVYELLYDGGLDDQKHLMGLIDPKRLGYDEKKLGLSPNKAAPSQGQVSPKSGGCQGLEISAQPSTDKGCSEARPLNGKNKMVKPETASSYRTRIQETPAVPGV
jgi:hypothetical protein